MKNLIKDFLKNKSWIELAFRDIHISVEHPIDVVYSFGYKTRIVIWKVQALLGTPLNICEDYIKLDFTFILEKLVIWKVHSLLGKSLKEFVHVLYKTAQHSVQFAPRY